MDPLTRLRTLLSGRPVALPPVLDRLSEWWWARPPRLRAAVAAVVAVGALALLGAGAARSPWGPAVEAPVAAADLPVGAPVTADAVVWQARPAGLVPADVLAPGEVAGRLRVGAVAGTVLTRRHVAGDLTDLLAGGEVAVPVPVELLPDVPAGAVVDVLASRTDGAGVRLAVGARVLAVDGAWTWLGVPAEAAPAVAAAAAQARLSLGLRTPSPGGGSPPLQDAPPSAGR